jgi:hypothetical protein
MKLFQCKKEDVVKSWSITLVEEVDEIKLKAVDSETGKHLVYILTFYPLGKVTKSENIFKRLKELEYNPYEHNNRFDERGRLIIN